jgi:2-polyprenyl-6-methoxyphenol hydroxylase-like FAD-dependent oxidoreductase
VVFSDRALDGLATADPETHTAIAAGLETWRDITLDIEGTRIRIDGIGFAAIGRLDLLRLLRHGAETAGVSIRHGVTVTDPDDPTEHALADADLVVAADGVNSLLRGARDDAFGTTVEDLSNRFAWFGTTKPFDTLTQTFRRAPEGAFNAHHYRYAPGRSTFIVETDAATWQAAGLATQNEAASKALAERVFADVLDGHPLISNRSIWRRFPKVRNARWHDGRMVLIGDALRTAHFSIGSGTRLALEDALALDHAFGQNRHDIPAALDAYEAARRPAVDKLLAAADASGAWYERFAAHMELDPWDFAHAYITRSGRVPDDRLAAMAPAFMAGYRAAKG